MEFFDTESRARVDERFALAVEELEWGAAELWFNDTHLDDVRDLRGRSQLERALIHSLVVGPAGLVETVCRRLCAAPVAHMAVRRERIFLEVYRMNLSWLRDDIAHGDLVGAADHFSRACHVPFVSSAQSGSLDDAFDALVEAGIRQEAALGAHVLDEKSYLQRPREASELARKTCGAQDPAAWMRVALSGLSSSSHHCGRMSRAVETMLHCLSWPTLRGQWWLAMLHPEAIPIQARGFPYVAVRWMALVLSEPPGEVLDCFEGDQGDTP